MVTRRELADLLGVHMMTVTKWERAGLPIAERGRKGKPSRYRETDVRAWLASRDQAAQQGLSWDLIQERAKKEHWQALLAEQAHKIRARELMPAAEVEQGLATYVAAVRTKILASYITHADRVHRAAVRDGLAGMEAALKDIAYDILRELAAMTSSGATPRQRKKARAA